MNLRSFHIFLSYVLFVQTSDNANIVLLVKLDRFNKKVPIPWETPKPFKTNTGYIIL